MIAEGGQSIDRIADRLKGRQLLVTGATGLLAKVFVEKLLRTVPAIGQIFLLLRGRADGTPAEERLQTEVLGSSVFNRIRAALGPRFESLCREKIRVVSGDLTQPMLGLSDVDYGMLTLNVDLIVNSAAAVTFDERLDTALALNALGPTRLLALARDCHDAPLMHVSTCYVSGARTGDIPEELAGPVDGRSIDPDEVVRSMQTACEQIKTQTHLDGEELRRKLIDAGMEIARRHGWNDTYTFTKWLGEQLVARDHGSIPVVILRPAIIESSLSEPEPGWIDGLRMADPMIIAYGRGKLSAFPADPEVSIDFIPVDLVANAMIAALPLSDRASGLQVYQVASSSRNPLRVRELANFLEEAFEHRPMLDESGREIRAGALRLVEQEKFVRIWRNKMKRAARLLRVLERLKIGASRRRRLASAISQIEQVIYFADIYSPYTHLDSRFQIDNLRRLAASMHPDDRREFPFAVDDIDWRDYIVNRHVPGLRKFVLGGGKGGEPPTLPKFDTLLIDRKIAAVRQQAGTVFEVFQGVAELCGDKTALQICRNGRWVRYSYCEALAATASIARRFCEFALNPGDRVVICCESCPEWGLTYLAAMRAGLTAVPLDPQLPPIEILECARFANAKLVCAGPGPYESIMAACNSADDALGASLPIVCLTPPFAPLPGASRDAGPPAAEVSSDHVASILFTSGTTIAPKAVPLTHGNFLANARSLLGVHALRSSDSFVSVLPMYHAFEFMAGFLVPLSIGATITYVDQIKGPQIVAAMQASKVTVMLVVPRLLGLFHDSIQRKVQDAGRVSRALFAGLCRLAEMVGPSSRRKLFGRVHRQFGGNLKMFVSGGSALDPKLYESFSKMGFDVCEGYGLTETAPVLTVSPPGGGKAGSAGKAVPGVTIEIRHANSQGVGELWAKGPNVMSGYLNNSKATAEVMRDGWFRTGDLGRCDGDGFFYITGRVKDMIVTDAGKNVYPDEVEARYKDLPYVKELCVVGMPCGRGIGEAVHAVVVPDQDAADLDPSTVERMIREAAMHLAANVPEYQRIQTLHFWNTELPKTSTLKVKRGAVRESLIGGDRSVAIPLPDDAESGSPKRKKTTEQLSAGQAFVVGLLSKISGEAESEISPQSNLLLDLGVDSLMKLQLISELEGHFEITCSSEMAASLARVSDLFALIGDKSPLRGKLRTAGDWWKRKRPEEEADGALAQADLNGAPSLTTLPARWAARSGITLFFRSYVRVRQSNLKHIPREGPFILAANHTSHLDSAAVLTAIGGRRRIWVAGAQDYFFNTRLKRWVFGRLLDTIPFDRQAEGFEGLARCLERLQCGDGLLFFPEGTRSLTGRMSPFKIGVALMALEANAPIIPTHIDHAFELLPKGRRFVRPGKVEVTFGEPILPADWKRNGDLTEQYQRYKDLAQLIQSKVQALAGRRKNAVEAR